MSPEPVGPFHAWRPQMQKYHHYLESLRARRVSGVYVIYDFRDRVLYVGESHTGRLYETITHHFRSWSIDPRDDPSGRRRWGIEYNRAAVRIAYTLCPPGEAQAMQYALIRQLKPRDNSVECSSSACARDKGIDDIPI